MMLTYKRHSNFSKWLKQLLKKFRTLEEDIKTVQRSAIELLLLRSLDNRSIDLIPNFNSDTVRIYKIRKFSCKSLKWKWVQSGIRIIFAYFPERQEVEYLEIYYKADQENMDYDFAKEYFKNINTCESIEVDAKTQRKMDSIGNLWKNKQ